MKFRFRQMRGKWEESSRNSTRMEMKRGCGARRKNEELAVRTKREQPEEMKLLLFKKLLPGQHICL